MNYEPITINEYFSDKDRIIELELQNALLRKKLKSSQSLVSKTKIKWQNLNSKHSKNTGARGEQALELIKQKNMGEIKITLQAIAKQCFITYQHVKDISSKYKQLGVK